VDVELTPAQPPEVERAIAAAIGPDHLSEPDPWWQAGVEEALET
jgi:hypothetical protein